ncbi:MAG: hypothetical protein ACTSRS_00630 [Candidatus Helarchaeota archaeon]
MDRKFITIFGSFVFSLLLFIGIIILGIIKVVGGAPIIPPEYISKFILVVPGPIYTDIIVIYCLPIGFFFLYYLISPYLNWFYIKIHKLFYWLIRRPSKYGIFRLGTKVKAGRLFYRAFVVSLFSFSIAFLLINLGFADLFRANMAPETVPIYILNLAEALFLATFILCPIMIILFFPIWQLEDSGVVSYRVWHEERMPADIQGVHSIYLHMLLGYAGVSTIFTWIVFISEIFQTIPDLGAAILTPIILIALPFIVTGILAIPIYLYEKFFPKSNQRLFEKLQKFNFPEIKIPHFEELEV